MIAVRQVGFSFGRREVLREVDFDASEGRIHGVLGPNGSGKTTLLRLMLGFLRPASGAVLVQGRPVERYRRREFARLCAAVPQEMPIDFPFTVGELVLLGRMPHLGPLGLEGPKDIAAAKEAMASCDVLHLADRPIHALSGGELRRAFLARALAQQARLLLLDEPTTGLDLGHQLGIFERLRAEAKAGRTVVVVVHDLNLALRYCDHLLLLQQGRAVAQGAAAEVLTAARVAEVFGVTVAVHLHDGLPYLIPIAPVSAG